MSGLWFVVKTMTEPQCLPSPNLRPSRLFVFSTPTGFTIDNSIRMPCGTQSNKIGHESYLVNPCLLDVVMRCDTLCDVMMCCLVTCCVLLCYARFGIVMSFHTMSATESKTRNRISARQSLSRNKVRPPMMASSGSLWRRIKH